ncbi:hypothetical protein PR048_009234 [Dryococelus australis]|uniref:Uncharacterized protein n=1 Tax=Dryococelus australis TaxID=614101 RepID=A0ABQ9I171_9NEOP|nr:hypothetical protein PR048_009234 [Dryococelus australis]
MSAECGINKELEKSIEKEIQKWLHILHAVIDVSGKFFNLAALMATHNPNLSQALQHFKKGQVSYLSKTTQNEVIELMAEKIPDNILNDVLQAKY